MGAVCDFAEQPPTIMSRSSRRSNPWLLPLVLAGIAFTLTASAYTVMAVRTMEGDRVAEADSRDAGTVVFLDRHGAGLMFGPLGLLAVFAAAAVRAERRRIDPHQLLPASPRGHERNDHGERTNESNSL